MSIVRDLAAVAKGMSVTFGEIFQPTEVENYPDGPGPMRGAKFEQRYRGRHVLQRDESGLEKCVACFLCAAACPSNCIHIEAAENTADIQLRALRQGLQHRLQPLHLLRLLR
jgi:NADH-quinone oxidoreductase subunit I